MTCSGLISSPHAWGLPAAAVSDEKMLVYSPRMWGSAPAAHQDRPSPAESSPRTWRFVAELRTPGPARIGSPHTWGSTVGGESLCSGGRLLLPYGRPAGLWSESPRMRGGGRRPTPTTKDVNARLPHIHGGLSRIALDENRPMLFSPHAWGSASLHRHCGASPHSWGFIVPGLGAPDRPRESSPLTWGSVRPRRHRTDAPTLFPTRVGVYLPSSNRFSWASGLFPTCVRVCPGC